MPNRKKDRAAANRRGVRAAPSVTGRGGRPGPGQKPAATAHREAQRHARRDAARKQRQRMVVLAVMSTVVVLAAIGVAVFFAVTREEPGIKTPDDGNQHLAQGVKSTGTYSTDPPTSGPHWQSYAPVGKAILTSEPDEANLHRLEHGYVVINHNCDSSQCAEVYNGLLAIYRSYGGNAKLILNYRPQNKERIALAAWRRLDTMEAVDEKRIKKFIDAYHDKGPERAP